LRELTQGERDIAEQHLQHLCEARDEYQRMIAHLRGQDYAECLAILVSREPTSALLPTRRGNLVHEL
jgi:hypothetical protein